MKYQSLMTLFLLSSSVFAEIDYSHCQKQFNNFIQPNKACTGKDKRNIGFCNIEQAFGKKDDDSSYYPFELKADGQIKAHPTLNYKNEKGIETVSSNDKNFGYETVINRNDSGVITGITTVYKMKNSFDGEGQYGMVNQNKRKVTDQFERKNETHVKLEIKNGKCIPSRVDTLNSLGDESRQDVSFDAKLCRNVAQFFKKNPEAASCFDNKLMNKANDIFNDYYESNPEIYGDVKSENFIAPRPLKTKLKSQLNGGYGYPGTGSIGGMGMGYPGMGFGMPGATTEQMLQPMMPSIDSILSTPKLYPGMNGFGSSPVVTAMQINSICQGGGFGISNNPFRDVITDESVWSEESSGQGTQEESVIKK